MPKQSLVGYRRPLPRLRERRVELGLTQAGLADEFAGVSSRFVSDIECRGCGVAPELQPKFAAALGLPLDALFAPVPQEWREGGKITVRCDGCGDLYELFRSEAAKSKSGRHYCKRCAPRRMADPVLRVIVSDSKMNLELRSELLASAGECGSPTCRDPECSVRPGGCHRNGCENHAVRAERTSASLRWVEGYPTKFCSARCGVVASQEDEHPNERARRRLDEHGKAEGVAHLYDVAQKLRRAPQSVARLAKTLGVGQDFPYFGPSGSTLVFSVSDVVALEHHLQTQPTCVRHNDLREHARWYLRRHKSIKRFGFLGGRTRNDARRDYEDALARIRQAYEETHATERELQRITGESRRMIRTALGRAV
jgi:transcriptional regulator with XRE-family HTH domain